jgi:hypothetical protein
MQIADIEDQFDAILKPLRECPHAALYHYTSAEGLCGIISTNTLWASDVFFMNDATEFEYGRRLILSELGSRIGGKNCIWNTGREFHRLPSTNPSFFEEVETAYLEHPHNGKFYVLSFCDNGNLLSQWRAYGENGAGYSVGIETKAVRSDTKTIRGDAVNLQKVIYEPEEQQKYIQAILDKAEGLREKTDKLDVIRALSSTMVKLTIALKDKAFREENEWRILYIRREPDDNDDLGFRVSGTGIIPYLKLSPSHIFIGDSDKLPIASINYGPTLHPDLTRNVLGRMKAKYGYQNIEIIGSGIPLRRG